MKIEPTPRGFMRADVADFDRVASEINLPATEAGASRS